MKTTQYASLTGCLAAWLPAYLIWLSLVRGFHANGTRAACKCHSMTIWRSVFSLSSPNWQQSIEHLTADGDQTVVNLLGGQFVNRRRETLFVAAQFN